MYQTVISRAQRLVAWMLKDPVKGSVVLISIFLVSGTAFHKLLLPGDSWVTSLWWSIKHLIDPGFLGEDYDPTAITQEMHKSAWHAMLGTVFTILGLVIFMIIFIGLITDRGAKILDRIQNGSLPKDMKNHLILIGSAQQLQSFIEQGAQTLKRSYQVKEIAVVVTDSKSLDDLKNLELDGLHLFRMTIQDFKYKQVSLQSHFAKHVVITTEENNHSGDVVYFVEQIEKERLRHADLISEPVQITIEIHCEQTETILQRLLFPERMKNARIHLRLINLTQLEARQFVLMHPFERKSTEGIYSEKQHIFVVVGWSDLAYAMIDYYRSVGIYGPKSLLIYLVDDGTGRLEHIQDFPHDNDQDEYLDQLGTLKFSVATIDELQTFFEKAWSEEQIDQVMLGFYGEKHDEVMHQAIDWEYRYSWINPPDNPEQKATFMLELPESSSYRHILSTDPNFAHFNYNPSRQVTMNVLKELDEIPKQIHQEYLDMLDENGWRATLSDGRYKSPSHNDWVYLPYACKGWNRSSADHFQIKLRLLANEYKRPQPSFKTNGQVSQIDEELKSHIAQMVIEYEKAIKGGEESYNQALKSKVEALKTLEALSIIEHDRWSSERYIQGWTYNPKRHDPTRQHNSLILYKKLTHSEKDKDRKNIVEQFKNRLKL